MTPTKRPFPSMLSALDLRSRWILLSVALTTLSAGSMGSYLVWASYNALRNESQQGMLVLSRSIRANVRQTIAQAEQAMVQLAAEPEVQSLRPRNLSRDLTLVTTANELIEGMTLTDRLGREISKTWPGLPAGELPRSLSLTQGFLPVAGAGPTARVDVYWTLNDDPALCIRVPVYRHRLLVGVLAGFSILPRHGIGRLKYGRVGKDGVGYLVDDQGQVLERGRIEDPYLRDSKPAIDAALAGKEGLVQFADSNGRDILAAFADVPETGWHVLVQRPAADCYRPAADMLRSMAGILLLAMIAASAIAALAARLVSAPIALLTNSVRGIEKGRADPEVFERLIMPAELALLARALATMLRQLRTKEAQRERSARRAIAAERNLAESERLASIGQLAAGLAHELNNPLTVIQGAAQVLPQKGPREARSWAAEIFREAARCQRLVKDLLAFARPLDLKVTRFSLRELCLDAWRHVQAGGAGRGSLELPKGDAQVRGDAQRLLQVLINVFGNALDAGSPEGSVVRITWSVTATRARLDMADSGRGFDGDPEALFRPFYTTKSKGTGLGLPLARAIARAHGGTLSARRGRKRGAVLTLQWPQRPGRAGARHPRKDAHEPA